MHLPFLGGEGAAVGGWGGIHGRGDRVSSCIMILLGVFIIIITIDLFFPPVLISSSMLKKNRSTGMQKDQLLMASYPHPLKSGQRS